MSVNINVFDADGKPNYIARLATPAYYEMHKNSESLAYMPRYDSPYSAPMAIRIGGQSMSLKQFQANDRSDVNLIVFVDDVASAVNKLKNVFSRSNITNVQINDEEIIPRENRAPQTLSALNVRRTDMHSNPVAYANMLYNNLPYLYATYKKYEVEVENTDTNTNTIGRLRREIESIGYRDWGAQTGALIFISPRKYTKTRIFEVAAPDHMIPKIKYLLDFFGLNYTETDVDLVGGVTDTIIGMLPDLLGITNGSMLDEINTMLAEMMK